MMARFTRPFRPTPGTWLASALKGIATALIVAAVAETECKVVTTSNRSEQGAALFGSLATILTRLGAELRDSRPT
jgi:hypothetical protein